MLKAGIPSWFQDPVKPNEFVFVINLKFMMRIAIYQATSVYTGIMFVYHQNHIPVYGFKVDFLPNC